MFIGEDLEITTVRFVALCDAVEVAVVTERLKLREQFAAVQVALGTFDD